MKSERSKPQFKPKFPRLQFLARKRSQAPPRGQWFATANDDHMVVIHPNR